MTAVPQVSVIIPAFNVEAYLAETLRSVQAQTHTDWEAIVVDDASPDRTREVAGAFARADPRIRCLALGQNSGRPAVPRNRGLAEARGELVAFLDADDLWAPRKLADQVASLRAHPEAALAFSIMANFGPVRFLDRDYGLFPLPFGVAASRAALERRNAVPCSTVLARREVVTAVGGFDEDPGLRAVEDYDLWLRLSGLGHALGFIPRLHAFHRMHGQGLSVDPEAMNRRLQYLGAKHQLAHPYQRRPDSAVRRVTRSLVHWAALNWVRAREQFERRAGRPVPLGLSLLGR